VIRFFVYTNKEKQMKKIFFLFFLLISFVAFSKVTAASQFKGAYVFGMTGPGGSIGLAAAASLYGTEGSSTGSTTPSVDFDDGNGNQIMGYDFQHPDETGTNFIDEYFMIPGVSTVASVLGKTVTFTSGSDWVTGRIPSLTGGDGYDGLFQMPPIEDLAISGGTFPKPTISWYNAWATLGITDPSGNPVNLTKYEVRVYQGSSYIFKHIIPTGLEDPNQTFDFSDVDFTFDPLQNYRIRVEARKHLDLLNVVESNPHTDGSSFLTINRSTSSLDYSTVPIPGAIVLLGSGLLGLVGLRRKQS